MRSPKRTIAAVLGATALAIAGCGDFTGIYDLPLPGGADLGCQPYRVRVQFRDVLDLVPQSGVKVNEVAVGRVEKIALARDGWTAEVTVAVNGGVRLPANALAKVRQSSLLGEKYVELSPPPRGQERGTLTDGALISLDRTNRNTEVEEVLGALSMLLNGGGVDQLRTITRELNQVVSGNEPQLRATLRNVNQLVSNLDARKGDITRALDGVNRLAATLNGQREKIAGVIDNITPGLRVLTEQRNQLVTMLQSLDQLSGIAIDTVNRSKEDLVADLKALSPTLRKLGEAGANLPKSLELLFTFPFVDAAVPATKGDYTNLYATLDLNVEEILRNLGRSRQNPLKDIPVVGPLVTGREGAQPNAPAPLPLPDLSGGNQSQQRPVGQPGQQGRPGAGFGSIFDTLLRGGV